MLKEKVSEFLDNLFTSWVDLGCDDSDELEDYDCEDDPDEYAKCRMQEVANDVDYWVDNELDFYADDEFVGFDKSDIKAELKKQLAELGYEVR